MFKNQRTETVIGRDCDLCKKSEAWPDETCKRCPSYQEDHYAEGIGPLRNCDYFCVAESPTLSPVSRTINGHSCWDTDAERVIYQTFKTIQEKNAGMRTFAGDFTYAVRCTVDKPSSKHLKACQHFLRARILERAVKDRPIMLFAMGITVLKALGISAKKYGDYQGNYTEIELSGRKVIVYGGLSKRQIDAKAGFSEVAGQQIELFLKAVQNNVEGKALQCTKTTADITRNYIFPKTLQEVSEVVDHIIGFHVPQNTSPEKHSISIDTETNTKYPHREKLKLLTVIVSWGHGKATSIPVEHPESTWSLEDVRPMLNKLFMCPKPKIFHNTKFDLKVLWRKGFEVNNIYWDTMLGEHLLAEDKKGFYGLKEIVKLDVPEFANYEDELHNILNRNKKTKEAKAAEAEANGTTKIKGIAKLLIEDDGFIDIGLDLLNPYGAIDGEATWRIRSMQMKRMRREDVKLYEARVQASKSPQTLVKAGAIPHCNTATPLEHIMKTRTVPTARVLARMELHGMPVDREYALELATKMDSSLILSHIELNSMLISGTKDALNPESSQQIAAILYSRGYVHPETKECVCYNGRVEPPRTDTGQISTNASFLRRLVTEHNCAFCAALLRHRAIKKARNTFVENILVLSAEDGRMHSNFHQHGTSSGRLSSSQENMQNIPKKIGGHNIKRMFVPTDSGTFAIVNTDAKAAEVRIYAAYSHDKNLIDALNKGMDPHSFFASIVYNPANVLSGIAPGDKHKVLSTVGIDENHAWNYEDFCVRDTSEDSKDRAYGVMLDKLRTIVKRVVFGILYGAAKKKIASIVGIPDEQAQIVIDTLFKMFPSIPNYIAITQQQLRSFGMVETFIGRRRRFDLKKLTSWQRSRAERQSINFKIQSTSSDIVMDVMASVDDAIRGDFGGQLMNTVHDSLVMQIPKKYLHQIPDFIQKHGVDAVAKKYPWLPVPFQWDVEMGPSYGELISARKYLDTMGALQVIEVEEDFMECDIRNELEEAVLEENLAKAI